MTDTANTNIITLEGSATPDLILSPDEQVLMDVSQGWRDLGFWGRLTGRKGRLIVTNERILFLQKYIRDFSLQQMSMAHAGYAQLGHDLMIRKLITGWMMLAGGGLMSFNGLVAYGSRQSTDERMIGYTGLALLVAGLITVITSKVQGLIIHGSGGKLVFRSQSIPTAEMAKVLTAINHHG